MQRRTYVNIFMVSAFTALCFFGLGWLAVNTGLHYPGESGSRIQAQFTASNGLVNDSDVRVSGVKVGKVTSIDSGKDGSTIVSIKLDDGIKLRRDTRAVIRPKSLLGEKFVELIRKPGSSEPYLDNNGMISKSQTGNSVEIDDVLNNMDAPTRQAFSTTLRELGVALDGRAGDVNQSIPELDQTAANLRPIARVGENRQKNIDRILTDMNTIMAALADEQDALGRVVDSGDRTFSAIDQRNQDLAGTLENLSTFFGSLDAIFADLTPADRASLAKGPSSIATQRHMLSLTNPEVDKLFPELLLAQLNYPNNQLSITDPASVNLEKDWVSAFSQGAPTQANKKTLRITNTDTNPAGGQAATPAAPAPAAPQPGAGTIYGIFNTLLGGGRP